MPTRPTRRLARPPRRAGRRSPAGTSRPRRLEVGASGGLFAAALLAFLAIGAALPVLPVFVRGPLHASNLSVGIVVGAFSVTSVFCRPLAGRFADSRGRRIVLVASALVMSVGGLLYLLAGSVAALILARLVVGMGEGALYTAGATWAVDLAPARRQGLALGLFGLAVWGGLSLGPLAGELLRSAAGYNAVWALTAVLPLVGAVIAARLPEPARTLRARTSERVSLFPRPARRPGVALALANFGYAALAGFVVLDLRSQGVGGGASVFTAFAAAVFLSRVVLSPLPDRLGPRTTATGAALLEALGLAIIALAHSLEAALGGALVMGIGFSIMFPSLALMVVKEVDEENRGSALGGFTAFFDIGVGLGAPLAGAAAALAGYPAVFLLGALAALGTAGLAAFSTQTGLRTALAGASEPT